MIVFVSPDGKQRQEVGENEAIKQRILTDLGWKPEAKPEAKPVEQSKPKVEKK